MKYKKILVTGSSGALGSGVKSISREYPGAEFIFLTSKDADLTDSAATYSLVAHHNPDTILHLAAVSGGIGFSMKQPAKMLRDNILMTFSVLDAAKAAGVKKTVMTLTTGMYPPGAPLPLKEEYIHDGEPHESNYGSSFAKRIIDPAIRAYREEFGMNVIGLAPSGIFGEGDYFNDEKATMVASLIKRFYDNRDGNQKIVIWGDGSPLREYTYAPDLARIYMWALESYDDAQFLNIGSTEENSVKDIAYMMADIMGIDRERIGFDLSKPRGVFRKNVDNSRLMRRCGFSYTPFRAGLEKTIKWYVDMREKDPGMASSSRKSGY